MTFWTSLEWNKLKRSHGGVLVADVLLHEIAQEELRKAGGEGRGEVGQATVARFVGKCQTFPLIAVCPLIASKMVIQLCGGGPKTNPM